MRAAAAALCVLIAAPAFAAAPAAKAATAKASAKDQKIRDLLKETGADRVGENMLQQMRSTMPPSRYDALAQLVRPEEIVDLLVPVYARHFDEDELDGLLAFYRSPLGQKLLAEMPAISSESMAVGASYARGKVMELQRGRSDVPPAEKK